MAAVGEVLGDAVTPEIASAWSQAVLFLARVLIEAEEAVYKEAANRSGGWRGFQTFKVVAVDEIATSVKRFTFAPAESATVNDGGFAFAPGQFISVKIEELNQKELTAPRHYTITSAPGEPVLSCSVKKVEGGVVSRYLHEHIGVGDTVELSPPFGCFTSRHTTSENKAVLVSRGIGVTPMVNLASALGDRVALVAHMDVAPEAHAHADTFRGHETLFQYNASMDEDGFAREIFGAIDRADAYDFYLCGAPSFARNIEAALRAGGAKRVFSESFKGHQAS